MWDLLLFLFGNPHFQSSSLYQAASLCQTTWWSSFLTVDARPRVCFPRVSVRACVKTQPHAAGDAGGRVSFHFVHNVSDTISNTFSFNLTSSSSDLLFPEDAVNRIQSSVQARPHDAKGQQYTSYMCLYTFMNGCVFVFVGETNNLWGLQNIEYIRLVMIIVPMSVNHHHQNN